MPAPADVQAQNAGAKPGRPEKNDWIAFTFAAVPDPVQILAGWTGGSTAVTVHIQDNAKDDVLTVRDASTGSALSGLGQVELNGDYANGSVDFTNSRMTASGNRITVVLGTPGGTVKHNPKGAAMTWWAPSGAAPESGAPDPEF